MTVVSEHAKVLKMTKERFEDVMNAANRIGNEVRMKIGRDIVDRFPLFKSLTSVHRKQVLEAMKPMTFLEGSYICRQGKLGNTFYIITEGSCRVTINAEEGNEKEVAKLHVGDFFGEVALTEPSAKRTANVISEGRVTCMTLARNEFTVLLKSLEGALMEYQALRGAVTKKKTLQHNRRRITAFDPSNRPSAHRCSTLLKRLGKYMAESYWNSIYARFYRILLLQPEVLDECGPYAKLIMLKYPLTADAVDAIREQSKVILEMEVSRRTAEENCFVYGLMRCRNQFNSKLCAGWARPQMFELMKKLRFMHFKAMRKVGVWLLLECVWCVMKLLFV